MVTARVSIDRSPLDPELEDLPARRSGGRRIRTNDQAVRTRREDLPGRRAAGDAEGVRPRKLVAQARQQPKALALLRPDRDFEAADRLNVGMVAGMHAPGEQVEERRDLHGV